MEMDKTQFPPQRTLRLVGEKDKKSEILWMVVPTRRKAFGGFNYLISTKATTP